MDEYYRNIPPDQELVRRFEADDKYWMIVDRDHPVHPYVDREDRTRIFRRKKDAEAFLEEHKTLNLMKLYIEEEELDQMTADWANLGIKTERAAVSGSGTFKESGRIPVIFLKIRQIERGSDPESMKDDKDALIRELKEECGHAMFYVAYGSRGEDFCLLDDPLIEGKLVGAFTGRRSFEAVYPDREGHFVSPKALADFAGDCDGVIVDPGFHGVQYVLDREKLRDWIAGA